MKTEHLELLQRLEACNIDDPASTAPFSARLAREKQWPLNFAQRVIQEYKRFAFLAVAAGHPVSPSHAVDEAWHLHLLYTKDYWTEFCGNVLRTSLHHHPSKGGALERGKFENWYADTLASYRRFFGEEPPIDIWPERNEQPMPVHFNPETHWVLPRPGIVARQWLRNGGAAASAVLRLCVKRPAVPLWVMLLMLFVAGCGPGISALTSPLDFTGPTFLGFYFVSWALALGMAALLRWRLRKPAPDLSSEVQPLDPYAVAYLAGGRGLTVSAALAELCHRGAIQLSSGSATVSTKKALGIEAHPMERVLYDLVAGGHNTLKAVREHAKDAIAQIASSLKERGLVVSDVQARKATLIPLMLAALVPALGLIKVFIGVERERPVGFLVAAVVLSAIATAVGFARRPLRTRMGDDVLARLRAGHQSLRQSAQTSFAGLGGGTLALALGLFGMSVLAGSPLEDLQTKLQPTAAGSTCGSGCGGSGCGGGGGGGGGCGGCGGGD